MYVCMHAKRGKTASCAFKRSFAWNSIRKTRKLEIIVRIGHLDMLAHHPDRDLEAFLVVHKRLV